MAIGNSWSEPQSAPHLVSADCKSFPYSAAKDTISLISVLTIWWCQYVESSLMLLEEGVCYDQCVLFIKLLALWLSQGLQNAEPLGGLPKLQSCWEVQLRLKVKLSNFIGDIVWEIDSHSCGIWKVLRSAVCKLKIQESQWCNSIWVQISEN